MTKDNKTLHLVLKRKWWDMIASGEKKEEYHEICFYWAVRLLCKTYRYNLDYFLKHHTALVGVIPFKDFRNVCFHLGYTNTTMTYTVKDILVRRGRKEWGAEPNKEYFVISLGERVDNGKD